MAAEIDAGIKDAIVTPLEIDPAIAAAARADSRRIEYLEEDGTPTGRIASVGRMMAQIQVSVGRARYVE